MTREHLHELPETEAKPTFTFTVKSGVMYVDPVTGEGRTLHEHTWPSVEAWRAAPTVRGITPTGQPYECALPPGGDR